MQELWWDCKDGDAYSESFLRYRKEHALEISMRRTGEYARLLANYPAGRTILDAEDPGEYAFDPSYWWARAEFYRLEQEKLLEEEYHRASRSVTPEVVNPNMPYMTELDRAKCTAGNVARMLADFPAGKALLEAENHGNPMKDGNYWWSFENWNSEDSETSPPEADDHGDTITDPGYWWRKSESYSAQLEAEREKTNLERAKRSANLDPRPSHFPCWQGLVGCRRPRGLCKGP